MGCVSFYILPVWLVCYANGFHLPVYVEWINCLCGFVGVLEKRLVIMVDGQLLFDSVCFQIRAC